MTDPGIVRRTLYPELDPYEIGRLAVGDGHELYWEQNGRPDGRPVVFLHGGPGRRRPARPATLPRPHGLPDRPLRPARLRPKHAVRVARGEHDLGPRRRHRAAPRAARDRPLAGLRRLVGLARSRSRTPRPHPERGHRARAARHLHAPPVGAPLVLPGGRIAALPGRLGAVPGADPRGRARRPDARLPPTADVGGSRRPPRGGAGPGASGRRRPRAPARRREARRGRRGRASPRRSPGSSATTSSTAGSSKATASCSRDVGGSGHIPGVIVQGRYDVVCPTRSPGTCTAPGRRPSSSSCPTPVTRRPSPASSTRSSRPPTGSAPNAGDEPRAATVDARRPHGQCPVERGRAAWPTSSRSR